MVEKSLSIRPSAIAGTWYSDDPKELRDQLNAYITLGKTEHLDGKVLGLIAPHAGYRYSGPTAGFAYSVVKDMSFDTVLVLSPFHAFTEHKIILSAHASYQTPLGNVPIDLELQEKFIGALKETALDARTVQYDQEHSLEIQLPFLQVALNNDFQLFPLMLRTHQMDEIEQIAQICYEIIKNKNVLLIASTDLSHFYNQKTANYLDTEMLRRIVDLSPESVLAAEVQGKAFACGAGAVAAVLKISQMYGAKEVRLLHYSTSGDQTGDQSSVVGYGAAAVLV